MSETRAVFVRLHRWVGLTCGGFLLIVGLTGAMLAFFSELNHALTPDLFPPLRPGALLGPAALARRAEAIAPDAEVETVYLGNPGVALVGVFPREPATELPFNQLLLDPVSGTELGRRKIGALPHCVEQIMPFVYRLHMTMAAGELGAWILGLTALAWTFDCSVGLYLTFPVSGVRSRKGFFKRWRSAWLIKLTSSIYRINFDLHRAGGLWLWAMLIVFAWSSVFMNLNGLYGRVMSLVTDYRPPYSYAERETATSPAPMTWEMAEARGRKLLTDEASVQNFTIERELALYLILDKGVWEYRVRSSRDIGDKYGQTAVWFDAATGSLRDVSVPTGVRAGNTITTWLYELHKANVFGLPYKVFVSIFGLIVSMLSGTGIYIWWKKRSARRGHERRSAVACRDETESISV